MMRLPALLLLLAVIFSASNALADRARIWIASGLVGGTYQAVYARNLARILRDYESFQRPSSGSGQNLDLLAEGQADVAFAQADVLAARLGADPARYAGLMVIGKLANECVYIAHRTAGPVTNLETLAAPVGDRPVRIAVGDPESGMSSTWNHLTTLDPSLAAAEVVNAGDTLALNQLAVGAFDAVGWVTDPINFKHKMLRAVMANDELQVMNLSAPAFVSQLPDGTHVYESASVKLSESWRAPKVKTICTSALLLVRKDANPALVNKLSDVLSLDLARLVGRR